MKTSIVILAALASCAAAQSPTTAAPPVHGAAAIDRVVNLLDNLKNSIQEDGAKDQQVYDKYACWCEQVTSRKAAEISAGRENVKNFGTGVLRYKGGISTLGMEVTQMGNDIKNNENGQEEATTIRQKQNANYLTEKAETEAAVSAIEKAMKVLRTAEPSALIQSDALESVKAAVASKASPRQLSALNSATQQKSGRYTPQSTTVQGILSDMYATFVNDMESAAQREGSLQRGYETLMATKQAELNTLQTTMVKKDQEKSESELLMADSTQMYSDAEAQLKSDTEFFDITKASCTAKAAEWDERKKLRAIEIGGVEQVVTILTSDESRALFNSAIRHASFLQIDSAPQKSTDAAKAFKALASTAKKTHSMRLAALAADLRVAANGKYSPPQGHFDMVLASIDRLLAEMQAEQKSDDAAVDQCTMQNHNVAMAVQKIEWEISTNDATIEKIDAIIEEKNTQKTQAQEDLSNADVDTGAMNQTRASEHAEYLQRKADDEAAIQLLNQAIDVLMDYYRSQGAVLTQQTPAAAYGTVADIVSLGAPDGSFATPLYRHNDAKGAKGVLELVAADLQRELDSSEKGEVAAEAAYKMQVEAASDLEYELNKRVTNLNEAIATREQDRVQATTDKANNEQELEVEQTTKAHIAQHCDMLVNGQADRRTKRNNEIEGLKQAQRFLKGAKSAFLQRH